MKNPFLLLLSLACPAFAVSQPTNPAASPVGAGAVVVQWDDTSSDETLFEIERHPGNSVWAPIGTVPANNTHYVDRAVSPSTTYTYRVRATDGSSSSAYSTSVSASTTKRMNIIFLLADDMGYKDIVGLRNPEVDGPTIYETPALDALINEARVYENAYCSGPKCVVSRRALLTGKYDWRPEAVPTGGGIGLDMVTYGEAMQAAGYRTCYIGKYHLGDPTDVPARGPLQQGFDVSIAAGEYGAPQDSYFPDPVPGTSPQEYTFNLPDLGNTTDPDEYLTDRLTTEATDFIDDHLTNNNTEPFFLTLAHYAVHTPLEAKPGDITYFENKKTSLATELANHPKASTPLETDLTSSVRNIQDNTVYAAMMRSYDDSLAALRAKLVELEIEDETIIIISSDHGGKSSFASSKNNPLEDHPTANYPYRLGKTFIYEGGLKIPLLVHIPGVTTQRSHSQALVHGADFYTTFLDLGAAPQVPTQHTDSISFAPNAVVPELKERTENLHFFTNASTGTGNPAMAAYRAGDYKLVYHIIRRKTELYHITSDIGEQNDLSEKRPELAAEMLTRLYEQVRDQGKTYPKPGSNSWDQEQIVLVDNGVIASIPAVPDAAPDNLTVTELSSTAVELNWDVNATNSEWSVIERRGPTDTNYREYDFVPSSVTSYRDTNLTAGETYRYRVQSSNLGGFAASATSNQIITLSSSSSPLALTVANDTVTILPDETRTFSPLFNDEGEGSLSITAITAPSSGTATLSGDSIIFAAPAGFAGGVTMTYTVEDSASQTATGTITFELPQVDAGVDLLERWEFNEASGTGLDSTVSSGTASFGGASGTVQTNGSGQLSIVQDTSDQFRIASPVSGGPYTDGEITMEWLLTAADLTDSANGANFGFAFRDNNASANFAVIRLRKSGTLQLEARVSGNTLLYDFGATEASDVLISSTLDLEAKTVSSSITIAGGSPISLPSIATDPAALQLDSVRFQATIEAPDWAASDSATIDYLSLSRPTESLSFYDCWADSVPWLGNSKQAPEEDADGDGVTNLMEFALGSDLLDPSSVSLPCLLPDGNFSVTPARSTSLLNYLMQESADLVDWTTISPTAITSPAQQQALLPLKNTGPTGFARLRVSEAE